MARGLPVLFGAGMFRPSRMALKRKVTGGVLTVIGFMLSPLSWWNDLVVNIPLALVFAWAVGLVYHPAAVPDSGAFQVSVIVGYWLTNVLGLVLMHKGINWTMSSEKKSSPRRELLKDVLISLAYTALIVVLLKLGLLKPFENYFGRK
jgi:hypothetical protein